MTPIGLIVILIATAILVNGAALDGSGKTPAVEVSSKNEAGVKVTETTDPKEISNILRSFVSSSGGATSIAGGVMTMNQWRTGDPFYPGFNSFCTNPWNCGFPMYPSPGIQNSPALTPMVQPFYVPVPVINPSTIDLDSTFTVAPSVLRSPGIRRDLSGEELAIPKPEEKISIAEGKKGDTNSKSTCNKTSNGQELPKLALAGGPKKEDNKTTVLLWCGVLAGWGSGEPCYFNPICSCKLFPQEQNRTRDNVRDVSCVGVPFSRLPDFPGSGTAHIDVVGSGLEAVEPDSLGSAQLLSVRLISNSIVSISPKAFFPARKTLRSLDLSYNKLEEVPLPAISPLSNLEWLNLHSNCISSVSGDWGGLSSSLSYLYLGENDLTELKVEGLRKLTWLNADSNMLSSLDAGDIPPSLQTLSVINNHIVSFPTDFLEESKRISWLFLRDNFINRIPYYNFKHRKKLEKMDLGENGIREIPSNPFNGTLSVRDLNLDLNEIRSLGPGAFRNLGLGRVYLSQNGLEELHIDAFQGLENTLEYLDLGGNSLQEVPKAISTLRKLKYLYLPSNNISRIPNETFNNNPCNLAALSLLGNRLEAIPADALRGCSKISHLNIGYNHIMDITEEDFEDWGESLDTLLLMNNRLVQIHAHTFRQTPRLRELSLSFNKISAIDPDAFRDVEESLESLEISFGLYQEEFPEDFLKPLKALVWLALDNNSFRSISQTALYSFKNLQYLNLDGNRLSSIPVGVFHPSVHRSLKDIRLSYNHISSIDPHTFSNLVNLQSIVLSGNQIHILRTNSFKSLPGKISIILSDNKLTTISPRSFNDIATLVRLDLQSNLLQEFSLSAFHNVTAPYLPLNLNLSRNEISNLLVAETMRPVCIHTIDLSHNQISVVPKEFFDEIRESIRRIYLGYNRIGKLDETAFGTLAPLQALSLQHNSIVTLRKRAFVGLPNLQILDLSHNHIEQIHMEQFKCLPNLRVVDLSFNHIRNIPRDAFQNTKLERIDLSNNEFVMVPSGALGEVGFTLRTLDLAHNQIEHLDATMFPETPLLSALNLGYNKITNIPENVFSTLNGMFRLDLAGNRLRANLNELLQYLEGLQSLNLADTGLRELPPLPLQNLVSLNLSGNPLTGISSTAAATLPKLRQLDLSRCKFASLPPIWLKVPILKRLMLSHNPLKVITKDSLHGLRNLEYLDLNGLDKLEKFDTDSLSSCSSLRTLKIQTWPKIEGLRIDRVTSETPGLRRLSIRVTSSVPPRLGKLGRKLRHLEVTGPDLKALSPEALRDSAMGPELVLQIRGTGIEELPLGLIAALGPAVRHISLDLRNNRLSSLSPDIFYYNLTSWENVGTKLISGGLMLGGNPWTCDCSLVWVGHWLRRWLRESLQLHRSAPEPQLIQAVREAVCSDPRTERRTPLVDLHPETLSCHASALSGGVGAPPPAPWALLSLAVPFAILLG